MSAAVSSSLRPWRFAPLRPDASNEGNKATLKGVVFDVDGTLWYLINCPPVLLFLKVYPVNPQIQTGMREGQVASNCHVYSYRILMNITSLPQNYMFQEMRYVFLIRFSQKQKEMGVSTALQLTGDDSSSALGIDKSVDIIGHIRSLPTQEDRTAAITRIRNIEREAMVKQVPQPGLLELMDYLQSKALKRALCTRNFEFVTGIPDHQ